MKKTIKKNSLKAPNYLAAVFAAIIILLCILFVTTEIDMYDAVISKRDIMASSIKSGDLDVEAIRVGHEECIMKMEELKDKSQLGNVLVNLDETKMGQVAAWMLIRVVRIGIVALAVFILVEIWKMIKIASVKIKRKAEEAKAQKENTPPVEEVG